MAGLMIKGIPVFEATLEGEDCGMQRISLVDRPAVESDFVKFAKECEPVPMYFVSDEDRQLVMGVVMRAEFPIYRRDDSNGEYYIIYTAETIREMAEKYLAEGRQNAVNLMHEGADVQGVQMVQYFIKDAAAGIAPEAFKGIEDGSLFAEFHISDEEIWTAVKDGTYRGFSLEGLFACQPRKKGQKHSIFSNMSEVKKSLFAYLQKLMVSEFHFGSLATDGGVLHWEGEEGIKVGDRVFFLDEEGNESAPADGDYKSDDKVVTIANGVVEAITEVEVKEDGTVETEVEVEAEGETTTSEETTTTEEETTTTEEGDGDKRVKELEEKVAKMEVILRQLCDLVGIVVVDLKKVRKETPKPSAVETFAAEKRNEARESYIEQLAKASRK